jgi:hypothetical protein
LLPVGDPDQRGCLADRVLSPGKAGLLHHLPGHQGAVLTEALTGLIVAASVIAGLSTLFSP